MSDAEIRKMMSEVPVPTFDDPAWVVPKPLSEAIVAIVTTAGLRHSDESGWDTGTAPGADDVDSGSPFWRGDESFRVLDDSRRDFRLEHWSPNFDRSGFAADLNVVFPVDRLHELADAGTIKAVSPVHIAFIGAQDATLSTIRYDSGPAAAKLLKEKGVDIVLLFPVCPVCSRTVGTLAHVFEAEGLATVSFSLIRGQTERIKPPRALYGEFPLGRPLGKPQDPDFQTDVLMRMFAMLDAAAGPVLENHPDVIEATPDDSLACTMPPRFDPGLPPAVDEAVGFRPAYDRHLERTGRSSVGRAAEAAQIPGIVATFVEIANGDITIDAAELPGNPTDCALDVRSYYEEAATEIADHVPAARSVENWFFRETETGKLLKRVQTVVKDAGADEDLWFYLAPLTQ